MKPRELPKDVYDTLELSALVYGGIGADAYSDWDGPRGGRCEIAPRCYVGHLVWTGAIDDQPSIGRVYGISLGENDNAVQRVAGTMRDRISFKRWCKELNVVRGK